jgi:hypothetical protein
MAERTAIRAGCGIIGKRMLKDSPVENSVELSTGRFFEGGNQMARFDPERAIKT